MTKTKTEALLGTAASGDATVPTVHAEGHTPGPWAVDNCGRDVRAGGVGGLFVARIYAVPCEEEPYGYGDEQLANARLIAAAPEAVTILKRIVQYIESPHNALRMDAETLLRKIEDGQ